MGKFANNIRPFVDAEIDAAFRDPMGAPARRCPRGFRADPAPDRAATKAFIGLVPDGNTGGAKVSAIKPMPVDPELQAIIEKSRSGGC
jgi:hypothetical protein